MKRANCCIENRSFRNYFTGQLWSTFHTFSHDTGSLSITQRLFSLLLEGGTPHSLLSLVFSFESGVTIYGTFTLFGFFFQGFCSVLGLRRFALLLLLRLASLFCALPTRSERASSGVSAQCGRIVAEQEAPRRIAKPARSALLRASARAWRIALLRCAESRGQKRSAQNRKAKPRRIAILLCAEFYCIQKNKHCCLFRKR